MTNFYFQTTPKLPKHITLHETSGDGYTATNYGTRFLFERKNDDWYERSLEYAASWRYHHEMETHLHLIAMLNWLKESKVYKKHLVNIAFNHLWDTVICLANKHALANERMEQAVHINFPQSGKPYLTLYNVGRRIIVSHDLFGEPEQFIKVLEPYLKFNSVDFEFRRDAKYMLWRDDLDKWLTSGEIPYK